MARVVPLIRAAALMPAIRWLRENGRSVSEVLTEAGHGYLVSVEPLTPVPLLAAASVLSVIQRREGPDVGLRMVTEASLLELAFVSRGILGARTPREAFGRVSLAIPHHCTHEVLAVVTTDNGIVVRDSMAVPLDPAARHVADQYILGLIREVCAMTGAQGPLLARVEMTPHPDLGLAHLHAWFGDRVFASRTQTLAARIDNDVADRPFRKLARNRFSSGSITDSEPLRGDGSLAYSIRHLLPLLLEDEGPTLDRLVALSGMTRRTLQRRLAEEDTSFSELFAAMRHQEAVRRLSQGGRPISEVSRQLGFSQQSALTRAVKRWTGDVPSRLKMRTRP